MPRRRLKAKERQEMDKVKGRLGASGDDRLISGMKEMELRGRERDKERTFCSAVCRCVDGWRWRSRMSETLTWLDNRLNHVTQKTFLYLNMPCLIACSNKCMCTQCTKPSYLLKRLMSNLFCIKYDFMLNYLQAPSACNVFVGFSFCLWSLCETFRFFATNHFYCFHKKTHFIILMPVLLFSCLKYHVAIAVEVVWMLMFSAGSSWELLSTLFLYPGDLSTPAFHPDFKAPFIRQRSVLSRHFQIVPRAVQTATYWKHSPCTRDCRKQLVVIGQLHEHFQSESCPVSPAAYKPSWTHYLHISINICDKSDCCSASVTSCSNNLVLHYYRRKWSRKRNNQWLSWLCSELTLRKTPPLLFRCMTHVTMMQTLKGSQCHQ